MRMPRNQLKPRVQNEAASGTALLWRRIRGVLLLRWVQLNIDSLLICINIKLFAKRLMIFGHNLELYRASWNRWKVRESVLIRVHFPMRLPAPTELRDLV